MSDVSIITANRGDVIADTNLLPSIFVVNRLAKCDGRSNLYELKNVGICYAYSQGLLRVTHGHDYALCIYEGHGYVFHNFLFPKVVRRSVAIAVPHPITNLTLSEAVAVLQPLPDLRTDFFDLRHHRPLNSVPKKPK